MQCKKSWLSWLVSSLVALVLAEQTMASPGLAVPAPEIRIIPFSPAPGREPEVRLPLPPGMLEQQLLALTRQVVIGALKQVQLQNLPPMEHRPAGSTDQPAVQPTWSLSRVDVVLGALDPRLRLAPCTQAQVYVPAGQHLWGRSRIGIRCLQGTVPWHIYLPVSVQVFGLALVPRTYLAVGTRLQEHDLSYEQVDLAADSSPAITQLTDAVGRIAQQNLTPGQSIRQADLKARRYFSNGDTVKLRVQGPGFTLISEGQAITPGDAGSCARIRTDSGRIVCAYPVAERLAELPL